MARNQNKLVRSMRACVQCGRVYVRARDASMYVRARVRLCVCVLAYVNTCVRAFVFFCARVHV